MLREDCNAVFYPAPPVGWTSEQGKCQRGSDEKLVHQALRGICRGFPVLRGIGFKCNFNFTLLLKGSKKKSWYLKPFPKTKPKNLMKIFKLG